ncbi:M48 family metallopeptidase [Halorarius litoreus]|uniref:M48 family metallopeptidase n=1 Tax=Halorarius litoreus TaxID=2962676 RepID=UPI0020CCA11A|nr:M48 family metallopeptidase [Halorarius litoreus]
MLPLVATLSLAVPTPLAFLSGRAARRRLPPVLVVLVAGAATALLATVTGATAALEAALPVGGEVATTLATLLVFVGPVPAAVLAAALGVGLDLRLVARGYVAVVGPALVALSTAPLFPGGWWLVAGVTAVGTGVAAGTPYLLPRVVPTRELTSAERAALGELGVPVRVLSSARPNALAAGFVPGARVVFLTEGLLARLPPAELRAVAAHEAGHHYHRHVALRLGAVAVFVLPWLAATAEGVPGAFLAGCLLAGPWTLGLFRLMRHTELVADRYAAESTDGAALARGLARLTGPSHGGPLRRLFSPHPPLDERTARLTGDGGAPVETGANQPI